MQAQGQGAKAPTRETTYTVASPAVVPTPAPSRFGKPRRRPAVRLAVMAGLVAVLALCAGAPAQAAITHPYTGTSFGSSGVGTSFGNAIGVTVEQSSGDVFVLDAGAGGLVYKFNAAGEPVNFSASGTNGIAGVGSSNGSEEEIAVDSSGGPAAGDIYVANNSVVRIYAASGAFLGELSGGEMCGVAVDPSGKVYVGIYPETVRRYTPTSNTVTNADETESMRGLSGVCNIAVDAGGAVYAATYSGGVNKYDALQFGSLAASGELVDGAGRTLAVDPTSGDVFIDEVNQVAQYEGSAEPPTRLGVSGSSGAGGLSASFGVGVDHTSDEVYAANGETVEIFGPGVVVAAASTEAATGLTSSEATLHGTVEPAGTEVTGCVFEYGTEAGALSQSTPCEPATPYTGSTPVAASAHLNGLNPGTRYSYRIVATGASGAVSGTEDSFSTTGPRISNEFASEIHTASALLHAEINPASEVTTYHVEYGPTSAYGSTTAPVELEAGEAPVPIAVHIGGLLANTTYHFRFVATNGAASATGGDEEFATSGIVTNESFSNVGTTTAALSAEIDPGGEATTYHVEYGTTTAYGLSTQPVSIGAGETAVPVIVRLDALQPDTTYHFRFVSTSSGGVGTGSDLALTTHPFSAIALPDGRGYEMVTPTDNQGAEPYSPTGSGREDETTISSAYVSAAAANGEAVAYAGAPTSTGDGNEGNGGGNQFLATRNPGGGWMQSDVQPSGYRSPIYSAFSSDLLEGILSSSEPVTPEVTGRAQHLYMRDTSDGSYHALFSVTPPNRAPQEFGAAHDGFVSEASLGTYYAGASADYTHLLFAANDALTPGSLDPGAAANDLYESVDGQLQAINVLPDGSAAPNATFGSSDERGVNYSHVISADGSRVFWTDLENGSLYMHEDGKPTVLIAEGATYLTASADGSRVLYTKAGDLYESQPGAGGPRDLTPGGEVLGLMGASEDLEYVYFVADGALAAGASAGRPNLYLLHGGVPELIATLEGEETTTFITSGVNPWQPDLGLRSAVVTPSGQGLVFQTKASLTGYDNRNRAENNNREQEVYVYDASSGELSCASCNPSGEPPTSVNRGLSPYGAFLPVSQHFTYQLHLISDSGNEAFFETTQSLIPQANDGKVNVYEWERDGAGSCRHANGCISLLSNGSSTTPSYLVDASASGDDVFLMTRSQLLSTDRNEYNDIYDARVGVVAPTSPPQCTGTGCQGIAAAPPVFATPASATFAGVGNFPPPPKPVSKPKKKSHKKCAVAKKKKAKGRKSAKQAKSKVIPCKFRPAKHARRAKEGSGLR